MGSISSPANPLSGCPYPAPAQSGQRETTKPTNPQTLKIAKMLLLLALLVACAVGLPQKVVFRELGREGSEEGCPRRDMIHWSDGQCFTVGEQGPCEEGTLLDRTGGCVNTTTTTTRTITTNTTTNLNTTVTADVSNATNELGCAGDQISFEGGCSLSRLLPSRRSTRRGLTSRWWPSARQGGVQRRRCGGRRPAPVLAEPP